MPERVVLPHWRKMLKQAEPVLGSTPIPELAFDRASLRALGRRLIKVRINGITEAQLDQLPGELYASEAIGLLGAAIACRLLDRGWVLSAEVGAPVSLSQGEQRLEPFKSVRQLEDQALDADAWRQRCGELELA